MAPGFFQAEAVIDVPGLDILSWMFDNPIYDLNKEVKNDAYESLHRYLD